MGARRARGFTLVELLVAMTLLALIAALLSGAIGFAGRGWRTVAERSAARDDAAAAQAFLRARLGEAAMTGESGPPLPLAGDAARLAFVAPWEAGPGRAALWRFGLEREGGALMLSWAPEDGEGAAGRRALVEGVAALRLAYFGGEAAERGWRALWPEEEGAPSLVRVELDFEDPARLWPPLVIRRVP